MDKYYIEKIFKIIDDKILEQREKLVSGCISSMEKYNYEYGKLSADLELREEILTIFKVNGDIK
jgi:hypothetical protein